MKRKVYTVRACRWGDRESHSYIVGVYTKEQRALTTAKAEEEYRGGKYECEVLEWELDADDNYKVIKPLPIINTLRSR